MKRLKIILLTLVLIVVASSCRNPVSESSSGVITGGSKSVLLQEISDSGKDFTLKNVRNDKLSEVFVCAATSAFGTLYVDTSSGGIAFEDGSGNLWQSALSEDQMDFDLLTPNQKRIITTPLVLEYTFLNNRNGVTTKTAFTDLDPEVSVHPIENGALIVYYAKEIAVRIYVKVTLEDGALRVFIPEDGIEEGVAIDEKISTARQKIDEYVSWINNAIEAISGDSNVSSYRNRISKLKTAFEEFTEVIYEIQDAVDIKTEIDKATVLLEDVKTVYKGGVGESGLFNLIQTDSTVEASVKDTYKAIYNRFDSNITQIKLLTQQLSSIKYGALTTLYLYPNFGAISDTESGYVFYPDGCGAISYASTEHPSYSAYFLKDVYSDDSMSISDYLENAISDSAEKVLMPVFGIKRDKGAYVAVVDEGTAYAAIQFSPSGLNVNAQRVNSCFRLRRLATVYTKGDSRGSIYEIGRFKVPFAVNYYFLQEDEADYSGMANRYRQYLLDKGLLQKSNLAGTVPVGVNLIMGVVKKGLFANEFSTATTFEEAGKMADFFSQKETDIMFSLRGFTPQGYSQPVQADARIASKIGGKKGFEAFSKKAADYGIKVFAENGYTAAVKSTTVFKRADFVYDSSGTTLTDKGNRTFLITPEASFDYLSDKQIRTYLDARLSGVLFRQIGDNLFYDYNSDHPMKREDTMEVWKKMMTLSRNELGLCAVSSAGQYAFASADWITEAPAYSTGYVYTDQSIPFYQIVLHGYVLYSSKAFNKFFDTQYEKLKAIEYGSIPVFTLTACETSELKNTSCRNEFSTCFDDWKDYIVEISEEFRALQEIAGEEILRHEMLSGSLVKVTYANDMCLLINYGTEDVTVNGNVIPAMDYRLSR